MSDTNYELSPVDTSLQDSLTYVSHISKYRLVRKVFNSLLNYNRADEQGTVKLL